MRRRKDREREKAMKSPEGRWRLEISERSEAELLDLVRVHLERGGLPDPAERCAFANAMLAMHPDWIARWRRGMPNDGHTVTGSKKLKERARLVDAASANGRA